MKKVKVTLVSLAFSLGCVIPATAQEESSKGEWSVGADVVSTYLWRGQRLDGASVQPSLDYSIGGFSIGAWSSTGLSNTGINEVDFSAGYDFGSVAVLVTDYFTQGEYSYFKYEDAHILEGTIAGKYKDFSLSVNVSLLGADKKADEPDKQNFSTYIEAGYEFSLKDIDLALAIGATPSAGIYEAGDGFNVVNISLTGSKTIKVTDSFSIPFFGSLVLNPNTESIYFAAGISF